jgi:hypothetical protein
MIRTYTEYKKQEERLFSEWRSAVEAARKKRAAAKKKAAEQREKQLSENQPPIEVEEAYEKKLKKIDSWASLRARVPRRPRRRARRALLSQRQ